MEMDKWLTYSLRYNSSVRRNMKEAYRPGRRMAIVPSVAPVLPLSTLRRLYRLLPATQTAPVWHRLRWFPSEAAAQEAQS